MEMLRDIPGYKAALKAVLKSQIQFLAEQLSSETDEETVILSASTADGSLCQLGSLHGKSFLKDKDDIQSQFSQHCLQKQWEPHTGRDEITSVIDTQPAVHQNIAETLSRDVALAESSFLDQPYTVSAVDVTKHGQGQGLGRKKRKGRSHDNSTVKSKKTSDLNESSEREENDQDEKMEQETEISVDNMTSNLDITGDSEHIEVPTEILETVVKTDDGIDDGNKVKVEPESDDGEGDNFDDGSFSSGDEKAESSFKEDKTPKLEVAEPEKGKKANDTMSDDESTSDDESYLGDYNKALDGSMSDVFISEKAKTSAEKSTEKPSCLECGKTFSSRSSLKRHTNIHLPNMIRCSACHQYFKTEQEKLAHINNKHNNICHICGKTCKRDFNSHIRSHDETATAKFSCPFEGCAKTFQKKAFYEDHINTHTGHEPYECQSCSAKFKSRYERNNHFRQCVGLTTIKCDICQQTFTHRASLYNHKAAKHSGQIFRCECGATFTYATSLTRHKKRENHM